MQLARRISRKARVCLAKKLDRCQVILAASQNRDQCFSEKACILPLVADVFGLDRIGSDDSNNPVYAFNGITDFLKKGSAAALHGSAIPPYVHTSFAEVFMK